MPNDELEYTSRRLVDWMQRIHDGRVALPTWQRSLVWDVSKVKSLVDSLLRDRPVGTLLLMPKDESRFRSRPIRDTNSSDRSVDDGELILDGQQRLTALWRAFHDNPERLFVRVFNWEKRHLSVEKVCSAGECGLTATDDDPHIAVQEYDARCIPLAVLGIDCVTQSEDAAWQWCNRAKKNDGEAARRLHQRIQRELAEPFRHRRLWHLMLPRDVSREEAIEIYIRTNESSAVIRRFDIAVAMYDSDTGNSLREEIVQMVDEMGASQFLIHSFFDTEEGEDGLIPSLGEVLFKVACLWTGFAPTEGKYTKEAVLKTLRTRREDLRDALTWALDLYRQEGIPDRRFVPSDVPLRVLPALYPVIDRAKENAEARVQRYVREYLWRAFLTDRYSRSANTRLHEDYRAIESNLRDNPRGARDSWRDGVPIFSDSHYPIPDWKRLADLDGDVLRSPRSRNTLAKAVFAISLRDGRDFATGQPAGSGLRDQRWDYHHLFPKDYLRKHGLLSRQINHGMNFALVTAKTNSIIRNQAPHKYLASDGALARAANGEAGRELPQLVHSHQIPYRPLVEPPRPGIPQAAEVQRLYRAFIEARAKMLARAMKDLVGGQATVAKP